MGAFNSRDGVFDHLAGPCCAEAPPPAPDRSMLREYATAAERENTQEFLEPSPSLPPPPPRRPVSIDVPPRRPVALDLSEASPAPPLVVETRPWSSPRQLQEAPPAQLEMTTPSSLPSAVPFEGLLALEDRPLKQQG